MVFVHQQMGCDLKWDLVLSENLSFSLTPQFIEVLERASTGPNCFNSFFVGRTNR